MKLSEKDYSRKWYVMAGVSMGTLLATIDGSIVNVALPTLVRELNTDFPTIQWVVLAYLLTLAVLLLSIGRLGDMIGKKRIYTTGFAAFTISSFLCGLALNVHLLILFRVIQAIGATMILALGTAIVTESFPSKERGKALGIIGTTVSVGIVIGPTLGGLIIDLLSWHWIFFVNMPVGILGIFMVMRFVPDIQPVGKQRFDFWGAITLFLSLLAFLFALTIGQNIGFSDYRILILLAIWLIFLGIFIRVEQRAIQPMIDLTLFRNALFSINLVTGFITFIAIAGMFILMPFFLENILNYDTRQVGLLIAAVPVAMGVIAPLSGSLSDRFGTRIITFIGLCVLLFSYASLTLLSTQTSTISFIFLLLPIGLGMGIFQSPNNSAIMGTAPPEKLGVVSGMLALTRTLGQSTGIAIIGAIWAALTLNFAGDSRVSSATDAPAAAQVSALQNTFIFVASIILVAVGLALWALIKERRMKAVIQNREEAPKIAD
ncbi:MAG: MFS transporter [Anaerolineales bacterium]|jgi:EmrB/QacA subfamily drug resistance transporter